MGTALFIQFSVSNVGKFTVNIVTIVLMFEPVHCFCDYQKGQCPLQNNCGLLGQRQMHAQQQMHNIPADAVRGDQ